MKSLSILICALIVGLFFELCASEGLGAKPLGSPRENPSVMGQTTVFTELGGMGASILSLHLEQRLGKKPSGFGFRAGAGLTFPAITIPVGVNYLLGRRKHFLELGLGSTLIIDLHAGQGKRKQPNVAITSSLGYRYQKPEGGISWGVGISPLYSKEGNCWEFVPYIPYLRLGYTF